MKWSISALCFMLGKEDIVAKKIVGSNLKMLLNM